jgi:hypothetical protein
MQSTKMSPRLQSQIAKSKEEALAAFVSKKAEIDEALARLQALSDDHFNYSPDGRDHLVPCRHPAALHRAAQAHHGHGLQRRRTRGIALPDIRHPAPHGKRRRGLEP